LSPARDLAKYDIGDRRCTALDHSPRSPTPPDDTSRAAPLLERRHGVGEHVRDDSIEAADDGERAGERGREVLAGRAARPPAFGAIGTRALERRDGAVEIVEVQAVRREPALRPARVGRHRTGGYDQPLIAAAPRQAKRALAFRGADSKRPRRPTERAEARLQLVAHRAIVREAVTCLVAS
jgi:hypothetical protein